MQSGNAVRRQSLGLSQLRAAYAERTGIQLTAGDVGAFMGLGMRSQGNPALRRTRGHFRNVAIKRIEIQNQNGCVERGTRSAPPNQIAMQPLVIDHANRLSRWEFRNLPSGSKLRRTARKRSASG